MFHCIICLFPTMRTYRRKDLITSQHIFTFEVKKITYGSRHFAFTLQIHLDSFTFLYLLNICCILEKSYPQQLLKAST